MFTMPFMDKSHRYGQNRSVSMSACMMKMVALISSVLSILWPSSPPQLRAAISSIQLPKVIHRVVTDEELNKYRQVFVIGDIHGCGDELVQLLDEANATDDGTLKIFVGDMITKGPDSPGVLKMIQSMAHLAVRGNNEEYVLREYRALAANPNYILPFKYEFVRRLDEQDIKYLDELPYRVYIPSLNSIIVHAGLVPGRPLCAQQPVDMTTMKNVVVREYYDDVGIQAYSNTKEGVAWATLWSGPLHVYFGHDSARRLQQYDYATGIDTGCVFGGYLMGIFISGERKGETVSVLAKYDYTKNLKKDN